MKTKTRVFIGILTVCVQASICFTNPPGVKVGAFKQEVRTFFTTEDGLPSDNVYTVAVTENGIVYAGTDKGLAVLEKDNWKPVQKIGEKAVPLLAAFGNRLAVCAGEETGDLVRNAVIYLIGSQGIEKELHLPDEFEIAISESDLVFSDQILLGTREGLFAIDHKAKGKIRNVKPVSMGLPANRIRQIAVTTDGSILAATKEGLFKSKKSGKTWNRLFPNENDQSWALADARGVAVDRKGRSWFASPQGAGYFADEWKLFTGRQGLPYNDFTAVAAGEEDVVWFGTHKGAIRFDDRTWEYRQGLRWLPDDDVRDIVVTVEGNAWFATAKGVGLIERRPMTLAEKAKWYEDEIDRYHRRTPYEYVLQVYLQKPGDKSKWQQTDSDNDGLWTSMYGAGECFAYAATGDPMAKERATKAFAALQFLGKVTQGAEHSPPPGFVARTILPTSGPDPNIGRLEKDIESQKNDDKLWKVYEPRWPKSADGKWYWKTDTSSDELDGHYFFYAQYYDLVAETKAEKTAVREHVRVLTDHLIEHGFRFVDHDGKPTRWGHFDPQELNYDKNWFSERGLNSLSMLSYLAVAGHITGDPKYQAIADTLIEKHSYLQNVMRQKLQRGIGTGNQSDDEMAFMCYYNLLNYEKDPEQKSCYALSFWQSWRIEEPEMNPFFNFAFAATCTGLTFNDAWGKHPTDPVGDWLEASVETLKRFPLDRCNWGHQNSQRLDLLFLHKANRGFDEQSFAGRGYRVNGKVIPVDECYFNHYNYDPWRLDTGGNGHSLGDGTVFLLPYYMGLYHGFIED